jgi:hypothetical protein
MSEVTIVPNDGFAVPEKSGGSAIVGKLVKFSVDGKFVVDKTEPMAADTTLVAMAVVTAWVCWKDGSPVEHRITQPGQYHPDREELGDLDEKTWEVGLNDKPSDPWRDTRYLHLIDPQTGADFTFVTDTFGGRRGIGDLKSQIANVRSVHPAAVPIVKPCSVAWKTRYGIKQRPEFKVVGWRGRQETVASVHQVVEDKQRKPLERRTTPDPEPMNDEIPF